MTRTGCGALCPAYGRGCYGCFGPRESANTASLAAWLGDGRSAAEVGRLFAGFTAWSAPFRSSSMPAAARRDRRSPIEAPAPETTDA